MSDGTLGTMLSLAQSQIGYRGTGKGYSSDMGFPVTEWCAIFTSWLLRGAGVPGSHSAMRVTQLARAYAIEGRLGRTPKVGSLACFDWEGNGAYDHIGVVELIRSDGRLQTIEGNTRPDDRHRIGVYRMARSVHSVRSYIYPAYAQLVVRDGALARPRLWLGSSGPAVRVLYQAARAIAWPSSPVSGATAADHFGMRDGGYFSPAYARFVSWYHQMHGSGDTPDGRRGVVTPEVWASLHQSGRLQEAP